MAPELTPLLPSVLLLDDEAGDRERAREGLAREYLVAAVADLQEALAALRESDDPAAVVVDLDHPGTAWTDALRQIRQVTDAPIIVWTGSGGAWEMPLRGILLEKGAEDVVRKDPEGNLGELLLALADALSRRRSEARSQLRRLARLETAIGEQTRLIGSLQSTLQEPLPAARQGQQQQEGASEKPGMDPRRLAVIAGAVGTVIGSALKSLGEALGWW